MHNPGDAPDENKINATADERWKETLELRAHD
jgi:hypothetical protein